MGGGSHRKISDSNSCNPINISFSGFLEDQNMSREGGGLKGKFSDLIHSEGGRESKKGSVNF